MYILRINFYTNIYVGRILFIMLMILGIIIMKIW